MYNTNKSYHKFLKSIIFIIACLFINSNLYSSENSKSPIEIRQIIAGQNKETGVYETHEFLAGTPIFISIRIGNFTAISKRDNILFSSVQTTISIPTSLSKIERKKYVENKLVETKRFVATKIASKQKPWCDAIKFEIVDAEGNDIFKDYNWKRNLVHVEIVEDVLFESKESSWIIPPEEVEKYLPEGTYKIKAVFNTKDVEDPESKIWKGNIQSGEDTIVIRQPILQSEKAKVLSLKAYYYDIKKDYSKVKENTIQALSIDSTCLGASILLAEYYEQKGDLKQSLFHYQRSLEIYSQKEPNSAEVPIIITSGIERIKEKLTEIK